MKNLNDYRTPIAPTWCPGCHNFFALSQLTKVLAEKDIETHNLVFCHDIGCGGNLADFLKSFAIHTLHGRAVAVAMGVKLIKPDLTVCVYAGDGGAYGEGLNHLVAAARANSNIKVFVANNSLYSLTTGQTSPTTPQCAKTKSTPFGNPNIPIHPIELIKTINPNCFAKIVDCTDIPALHQAMTEAFEFDGFAILDMTQTCITFGKQLKL